MCSRTGTSRSAAPAALLVLLLPLLWFLTACDEGLRGSPASTPPWKVGFWLWPGAAVEAAAAGKHPFDLLYVQAGRADSYFKNSVSWQWPQQLPPAAEYWALWRYDPPAQPADGQIAVIAGDFLKRREEAAAQGQTLVGIQLDYDCPTEGLAEYAAFLDKLRKALPDGTRVSITALLDWFRPGTGIRDVLARTSEFVPQFYDTAPPSDGQLRAIAEPIDAARLGPVFNSFGIPYRVGITSFGRIALNSGGTARFFRDLAPLDVLDRPGLKRLSTGQTPSGEERSVMRVERPMVLDLSDTSYWNLKPGDQIELIMPTRRSVLAAYDAAKKLGGFCAGVVFFRWPSAQEVLVLNPAQLLGWVGRAEIVPGPPAVASAEGDCAAVSCQDLELRIADRMPEKPVVFRIRSSLPLEYFLPNPRYRSRITVTGTSGIRVALPASHGAGSLYLGRAVTLRAAQFTVTEGK